MCSQVRSAVHTVLLVRHRLDQQSRFNLSIREEAPVLPAAAVPEVAVDAAVDRPRVLTWADGTYLQGSHVHGSHLHGRRLQSTGIRLAPVLQVPEAARRARLSVWDGEPSGASAGYFAGMVDTYDPAPLPCK